MITELILISAENFRTATNKIQKQGLVGLDYFVSSSFLQGISGRLQAQPNRSIIFMINADLRLLPIIWIWLLPTMSRLFHKTYNYTPKSPAGPVYLGSLMIW